MITWLPVWDRADDLPVSYTLRLDQHLTNLLAPFDTSPSHAPLVALAYWGVQHIVGDADHAQRLRVSLDELAELPHNTLETLLRRSLPQLDSGLNEAAACVLAWLTEYMQLGEVDNQVTAETFSSTEPEAQTTL